MAMSAAAINDVVAWVLLALAVAVTNSKSNPLVALWVSLLGIAFLALTFLVVSPITYALAHYRELPPEPVVAMTLLLVLGAAFLTDLIGIHVIFGAFICEQGVVDNATTITFPAMMHSNPGAMISTVPGMPQAIASSSSWTPQHSIAMQQTIASSSSWTPQHSIASSSQHARVTQEFAVQTGLQTGPALNYWPPLQQILQGPRSSSSFTGPEYYSACIGADAGQRSSFSDDVEEVQSQFENFPGYGEGALFSGFDHPPADGQSSTYPRPNGMGNFGYGQPPGRNS